MENASRKKEETAEKAMQQDRLLKAPSLTLPPHPTPQQNSSVSVSQPSLARTLLLPSSPSQANYAAYLEVLPLAQKWSEGSGEPAKVTLLRLAETRQGGLRGPGGLQDVAARRSQIPCGYAYAYALYSYLPASTGEEVQSATRVKAVCSDDRGDARKGLSFPVDADDDFWP